jgi:hypothetical protein
MVERRQEERETSARDEVVVGRNRLLDDWPNMPQPSTLRREKVRVAHRRLRARLGDTAFVEAVADQGLDGQ